MLDNEQVCRSAAVALGYLSFNACGAREMLVICRNTPGLYSALEQNLGSGKMSMEFVDCWQRSVNVGLPSQRLEFFVQTTIFRYISFLSFDVVCNRVCRKQFILHIECFHLLSASR